MLRKSIFCASMVLMGTLFSAADNNDWGQIQRYDAANKERLASGKENPRVVFIGNSITDNWAAWRPQFFDSNNFVGRGISGQTSYQFIVRFREDVVNLAPRAVVINVGTNDVAENTGPFDEDRTFGNIQTMVEVAKANGIDVILTTVLPAASFGWNPAIKDAPAKIKHLNERIAKYAKDNSLPFVDYFTPLVDADGFTLNPGYSNDGVHPTEAGYEIMEKTVLDVINKSLK